MRDPERIDRIIEKLRLLWHQNPDMRLGQVVMNLARKDHGFKDMWEIEDEVSDYNGPWKRAEAPTWEQLIDEADWGYVKQGLSKLDAILAKDPNELTEEELRYLNQGTDRFLEAIGMRKPKEDPEV